MFRRTSPGRLRFLAEARDAIGYVSRPGQQSYYGSTVGYPGLPWSGAFIDVIARVSEVTVPAMVYSPAGLAEFNRQHRVVLFPQPGDIVFFAFSTGAHFDMPHVGIVSDVTDFRRTGRFRSIEGQVDSGSPKGSPAKDGVYERVRFEHDVLAFARPSFKPLKPKDSLPEDKTQLDGRFRVKLSHVQPGNRRPLPGVERVQLALEQVCSLRDYELGIFDRATRSAYARYQRSLGYVGNDAMGVPDTDSLTCLGNTTGLFFVVP